MREMDEQMKVMVAEKVMTIRDRLEHVHGIVETDPVAMQITDLAQTVYDEVMTKMETTTDNSLQVMRALQNERTAIGNAIEAARGRAGRGNSYDDGLDEALNVVSARGAGGGVSFPSTKRKLKKTVAG